MTTSAICIKLLIQAGKEISLIRHGEFNKFLFALMLASLFSMGLASISDAATCFTCHAPVGSTTDIRPVDAAYRNISTGGIKGSHGKHMPVATTDANNCTPCHGTAAATYVVNHKNGFINITSNSVQSLSYSKGSSFAQSGNPSMGTCSTASCHADVYGAGFVTTPTWGSAVTACAACHTTPITTTGPATGSHVKHNSTNCAACHTGATNSATIPAANHIDGNIDVANGYPANVTKHSAASGYGTAACSTASCHANVYGTGTVTTPVWGATAANCTACHATPITTTGPATGSHAIHNSTDCSQCHTGAATSVVIPSANHADGDIDVSNGYPANVTKHASGSGYSSCSTSVCHGASSPVWGGNTGNNTCTKCHGIGTVTITADNRELIAPVGGTLSGTGQVSNNAKVGAHQTHLKYLNGFSNYSTVDYRCETCHGTLPASGNHANGSSAPQFQKMATRNGAITTASFSAGSCSNVYCHNPASSGLLVDAGTASTPVWTNASYVADGGKSLANCQVCHLVPGSAGFSKQAAHGTMITDSSADQCNACHGHNGDTVGVPGQRHIDGLRYAVGGSCNACHDYDSVGATYAGGTWTGGSWGKAGTNYGAYPSLAEGWGAHSKHINHIKTRLGITAPLNASGSFGTGEAANICGSCHTNLVANHTMSGSTGDAAGRMINFGDSTFKIGGAAGTSFLFGTNFPAQNPVYSGVSGTSSSSTPKTCSNISCHYFTTPLWSAYP